MSTPSDSAIAGLAALAGAGGSRLIVSLFVNDVEPDESTVSEDLTPASFPGYGPLARNDWTAPAADGQGVAFMESMPFTWVRAAGVGAAQVVYGIEVKTAATDTEAAQVIHRERIDPPQTVSKPGDSLELQFTLSASGSDDPESTALLLGWQITSRAILRRLRGLKRQRVKAALKAIAQLDRYDDRQADAVETTGWSQPVFADQPLVTESLDIVRARCVALLAR